MRWATTIAIVAVAAYLALVAKQLDRPLMYDDANFALAARAVAETGLPFGNQGWMSERGDFSQREQWALWHPPLYVYVDGLLAKIGGWTPPVLRLLGVAGGLATAFLTYQLARELTRGTREAKAVAGGVAVTLVMLSPLVVQSTLILDIDFTLLLPLTLLFLLLYVRLEHSRRSWIWLAPLFGIMLWAKMTNPVPVVAVAVVWQVLRGKMQRAGLHALAIGGGGAVLFGVSWYLVGRWLSFPLDMPFGVNLVQWQDSADVARRAYASPGTFVEGLQPTVLWLGPGVVALGLMGVAVRVAQLVCRWRILEADLLIGLATLLVLGYVNKSAGWFPKYQVVLAPLLACLAAPLIAQLWAARPRVASALAILSTLAGGTAVFVLVRDAWALQRTWAIDPTPAAWLGASIALCTAAGVVWRATAAASIAATVGVALGWSMAIDLVQARAPYQTDYWYGTTGTQQAAEWVDAHLRPGETYVAAKEVAIRSANQRYVDQDNLVYLLSIGRPFDGTWAGEPIHALVAWEGEPYVADTLNRALPSAGFVQTGRFGDYVIYIPS
jgi:4-amino-4-deoxy-L-arabinose transferase-like glycosyltransferase